jgi:hypothetical protein
MFIRHPLLRIQSIYRFKRKQFDGTTTSKAAQDLSFDGWITHCFSDKQEIAHISNAQTRLLSATYRQRPLIRRMPHHMEYDIYQAIRNIENVVLLARTEFFDEDVSRFPLLLEKYHIKFKFSVIEPQNITSKNFNKSIDERVYYVKQSLSGNNFSKIIDANHQDMQLFEHASGIINRTQ